MRTEKEIIKKRKEWLHVSSCKPRDKNDEYEGVYFSGAWHALLWVCGDVEDI